MTPGLVLLPWALPFFNIYVSAFLIISVSCYTSFAPPVKGKAGKAWLRLLLQPSLLQPPESHLRIYSHMHNLHAHTSSGNRNKCTPSCEHTSTHNCICKSRGTYVNQINIYCSLCMVEKLMNIRQAHQACAVNMNKDIIQTEDRKKNHKIQTSLHLLLANRSKCGLKKRTRFVIHLYYMWLIQVYKHAACRYGMVQGKECFQLSVPR